MLARKMSDFDAFASRKIRDLAYFLYFHQWSMGYHLAHFIQPHLAELSQFHTHFHNLSGKKYVKSKVNHIYFWFLFTLNSNSFAMKPFNLKIEWELYSVCIEWDESENLTKLKSLFTTTNETVKCFLWNSVFPVCHRLGVCMMNMWKSYLTGISIEYR